MTNTAPRFKRTPPVQQYGSADIKHMSLEEIADAEEAGHLHDLVSVGDPDATVDHKPRCSKPPVVRDLGELRTIRQGDGFTYRCPECSAKKEI